MHKVTDVRESITVFGCDSSHSLALSWAMETPHLPKSTICQDPHEPGFVQDPYALYRRIHDLGTPFFWKDYGFWCVGDHATVNRLLRDRRFARLPPPGHELPSMADHLQHFEAVERHSLLSLEPPAHTRMRKLVNRAFASHRTESMAAGIEALAHRCIDRFATRGSCELLAHYATLVPVAVITQLLGVPESAGPRLVNWSHAMVRVYTLTQSRTDEIRADTAAREFSDFLRTVIHDKRRQPQADLLSQLVNLRGQPDSPSDEEIISVAILLLNAGHEATVHQLGNAVHTLLSHYPTGPRRRQLLDWLEKDDTASSVVDECMRFDAPLHLFMRYAQEAVQLEHGPLLQPGEQVGLLLAAANRCPRRFVDADTFRPLREDADNLSLGAGIHYCVGAHLARLELRIALQVLFSRLPALSLAGEADYLDAYHFHGLRQLNVTF